MQQSLKLLGSILLLGVLAPGVPSALSLPAQSQDTGVDPGVEKVEEVLRDLQENEKSEEPQSKTYTLAESDLNAYLEAQLKKNEHKGVDALAVRLKQHDNLITTLDLNMDELELGQQDFAVLLFLKIAGSHPKVEIAGELIVEGNRAPPQLVEDGVGTYQVKTMLFNGFTVPPALVQTVLTSVSRSHEPPFDPSQPFEMPLRIKTLKIEPGKVTIYT